MLLVQLAPSLTLIVVLAKLLEISLLSLWFIILPTLNVLSTVAVLILKTTQHELVMLAI
jgi:hypothetical protein